VVVLVPALAVAMGWAALGAAGLHFQPPPAPGDLASLPIEELRRRILLYLPFDTVVPEELVFRGVLLAELRRRFRGLWAPVLLSLVSFTIWHGYLGVHESGGDFGLLAVKLASYFAGGLLFTIPRLLSPNLMGCMVAHWLTDAVLMIAAHPAGGWLRDAILG